MSGPVVNSESAAGAAAAVPTAAGESLAEFKASFHYGSRADLLFKFLKNLPEAEAAEFLRGLLEKLGETIDDGDPARLFEHVYRYNIAGYEGEHEDRWRYDSGPFTPLAKPVAQSRLALLAAGGHFVAGRDPEPLGEKNKTQEEAIPRIKEFIKAEPILSTIPMDTPRENLRVRHPGYDIRAALLDPNVALPLERLAELAQAGAIGALLPDAFSFVGATAQLPLLKKHAPQWAEMLRERGADAVLLVPV